jgi:hypothetical protein
VIRAVAKNDVRLATRSQESETPTVPAALLVIPAEAGIQDSGPRIASGVTVFILASEKILAFALTIALFVVN